MTSTELIKTLKGEGLDVTPAKLRYVVLAGYIPQPRRDAVGNWQYSKKHVDSMRSYLQSPRKPGRHPQG